MKKKSELEGKIAAIKDMRDFASDIMKKGLGDKLGAAKKVTVASNSPEGLKEGLEKAKELLASKRNGEEEMPMMDEESEEETESEDNPAEEMDEMVEAVETPEEVEELIKKLEAKKAELLKK